MTQKKDRDLPAKIEKRLADLVAMKKFNMQEVEYCRSTYWNRFPDGTAQRHEWHSLLVSCFDRAQARTGAPA